MKHLLREKQQKLHQLRKGMEVKELHQQRVNKLKPLRERVLLLVREKRENRQARVKPNQRGKNRWLQREKLQKAKSQQSMENKVQHTYLYDYQ